MSRRLAHLAGRAAQARHKLGWGARIVGPGATAAGVVRLAALRLGPDRYARVRLRSGVRIGFEVPAQVPTALVVFRTLIDPEYAFLTEWANAEPAEPAAAGARPDQVVLDVGAAIGQFSLFAAQRPGTVVHAFEPSGRNLATLHRNLDENGLADRIVVHQLALADWEGEQQFTTQGNAYLSRPDAGPGAGADGGTETVPVRTLAGVCAELGLDRIAVLKVNVAGYEPEVLAGAVPLLARGAVEILVLLIGERSIDWYERCAGWGYRFFFYRRDTRTLHELADLSLSTLEHPPSPARHVIALHRTVLDRRGRDGDLLGAVRVAQQDQSGSRSPRPKNASTAARTRAAAQPSP